MAGTPNSRHYALAIGFLVLCVYLLSGSSDLRHNGDTDLRYQTAQAMVEKHRIWLADPMWRDSRVAMGRGDHLYAFYAPGQATLMVPLYVAGRVVAHRFSLPYDLTTLYATRSIDLILGALLAVMLFLTALALGYSNRVAAVLALIFAFATVAWPDAQSALEQTQVDLFLLIAVYCLLRWMLVPGARVWLVAAGTGVGLAVFTRYDAAVYLAAVGAFVGYWQFRRGSFAQVWKTWLLFGAGAAPWVLAVACWNWTRFGSPFLTGLHEQTFGEAPWVGLLSLLLSPGKGLFWYVPLVFALPPAAAQMYRRRPGAAVLFAVLVLSSLLLYSNVRYWHGDPAWGPRYLYAIVPYLILPLGEFFTRWARLSRWSRVALGLLVAIGVIESVSAVAVTQWRYWYRLQAAEERTPSPFRWGAQYYHYYWIPQWSPIPVQLDGLYQVVRLTAFGDRQYLLNGRPTVCSPTRCLSNPVDNYPVNTLAFWWSDVRHPLFGPHVRATLAVLLLFGVIASALRLAQLALPRCRAPGGPTPGTWRA